MSPLTALPGLPDPVIVAKGYTHPDKLVSTEWLAAHLGDPSLRILESDEDVLLYEMGHIPGAQKIDWHADLNDPVVRDYLDGEQFARLMSAKGISRDSTVVFYGDNHNWWAAYALWVFSLFGHPDPRLLDGGRAKWVAEGRPLTTERTERPPTSYPVVAREDARIRAFLGDAVAQSSAGRPLVDVRSPEEFRGERLHMPDYPNEGALRGGHIPGAVNVPWSKAINPDGTFKSADELHRIYEAEQGLNPDEEIITYCRIGERSSHTWFVLKYLLGYNRVRNYDGSWTEWGNLVNVPIER
mgnify:CR=1 FL=1